MNKRSTTLIALLFLLPNFLGFAVFMLGPVLFSLAASFTNWNLTHATPARWIGFENFRRLFTDQEFYLYFINTAYLMLGLPVSIAGSLFLAALLSQKMRGMVAYRTLFYLPSFTAGIALLILWKALYNPAFGPINIVIDAVLVPLREILGRCAALMLLAHHPPSEWLGLLVDTPPAWVGWLDLGAPQWLASTRNLLGLAVEHVGIDSGQFGLGARDAIIIMGIWTTMGGGNMLLYLAGISNIPEELYEAAEIDGAGRWAKFRYVTWPQLAPTTFFIVIMGFIAGLQGGFEQARVLTWGGPANTTMTLSYYIFIKGFEEFQIGYASAVAWVLFLLVFLITMVNWRFGSRYVND
jgi:multiple sugar transport system permease protein